MGGPGDKPKKSEWLRKLFDFVFGFENRRGEVLDKWLYSAEGLSFSSQEFYAEVERQIAARKFPGLETKREEYAEGGLLSDQRQYMRIMRERLTILACAAPFGNVYFFSCRSIYIPNLVRLWHILAAGLFFFLITYVLIAPLGFFFAFIAVVSLVFALVGVMRNAGALEDFDAFLLKIPVAATIYEDWFRQETYYREDSRTLYAKLLPEIIRVTAESACSEKGVKFVRQQYTPPILEELHRATEISKPRE